MCTHETNIILYKNIQILFPVTENSHQQNNSLAILVFDLGTNTHTYLILHLTPTHQGVFTCTEELDEHIASFQVPMSNVDFMEIL